MAQIFGTSLALADTASLNFAFRPSSIVIGGQTFLYVPSNSLDSVTTFSVGTGGVLTALGTTNDTGATTLNGAAEAHAFEVAGNPFLAVVGNNDSGVTIYALSDTAPYLTFVDRAFDSDDAGYQFNGAFRVETVTVSSGTYLYVSGFIDSGFSVFSVASDGTLTSEQNVLDSIDLEISRGLLSSPFEMNGTFFLPVGGGTDYGFSVFSIDDETGALASVVDVETTVPFEPGEIASVVVDGAAYLFMPGYGADRVAMYAFDGSNATLLQEVYSPARLDFARETAVYTVGSKTLIAFGSYGTSGLEVFEFDTQYPGLTPVDSVTDITEFSGTGMQLGGAIEVDGVQYAVVTQSSFGGVALFEIGGGDDLLEGTQGDDTMEGGGGDDILYGLGGDDQISGGTGDDVVYAGSGDDYVTLTSGSDQLNGGSGADVLDAGDVDTTFGGVTLDMFGDRVILADGTRQFATNFEELIGTTQSDVLIGNEKANVLTGEAGNDTLRAREGDDSLEGGGGADSLLGGDGDDTLDGGDQNDLLNGGEGRDFLSNYNGDDQLYGGFGDDYLEVYGGNNTLRGNEGSDTLIASGGDNDLRGGDDPDTIYLFDGNNFASGGNGQDWIEAGSGNDTLVGGADADEFVFNTVASLGGGFNSVRDFTTGEDSFNLTSYNFADATEVLALASDRSWGTRIDFADGQTIAIEGVAVADLSASDFEV